MNARRCPLGQRTSLELHADTLFIHGVPALVEGAEEGIGDLVRLDASRDAHVSERELGHEWVMGLVLPPPLEVEAEPPDDLETEFELLRFVGVLAQAPIIGNRLRSDGLDDRKQASAELVEDR